MKIQRWFPVVAAFLGSGLCLSAQPASHVSAQSSGGNPGLVSALIDIVGRLDQTRLSTPSNATEPSVIESAKKSEEISLRMPFGTLLGSYTLTVSSEDVLVARWAPAAAPGGESPIWLWDTPRFTTFVLEVPPDTLEPRNLESYLERLFVWDSTPVMLKSLKVSYLSAKSADRSASGDGSHLVAAQPIFSWWFAAATVKTKSYVVVAMGKAFFCTSILGGNGPGS
jgi:hypothetical protein